MTTVVLTTDNKRAVLASTMYQVTVHTGAIKGAGTDANVTINLHGENQFSGPRRLASSKNDFERGKIDVFKVLPKHKAQLFACSYMSRTIIIMMILCMFVVCMSTAEAATVGKLEVYRHWARWFWIWFWVEFG